MLAEKKTLSVSIAIGRDKRGTLAFWYMIMILVANQPGKFQIANSDKRKRKKKKRIQIATIQSFKALSQIYKI